MLRPSTWWGDVEIQQKTQQTQEPIEVTADGLLNPVDVNMLSSIYGEKKDREKFGGGPTFKLSLSKPGSVVVRVNGVVCGEPVTPVAAILSMVLDGKEMIHKNLSDKDVKPLPWAEANPSSLAYNEDFVLDVPAGEHEIKIDNTGVGWFSIARYTFRGLK